MMHPLLRSVALGICTSNSTMGATVFECQFCPDLPILREIVGPHAGRGVKSAGERFEVFDIERGDYFAHHSRIPTAEYLAQFVPKRLQRPGRFFCRSATLC